MSNLEMVMNVYESNVTITIDGAVMEGLKIPGTTFDITIHEIGTSNDQNGQEEGTIPHTHIDKIGNTRQPFSCIKLDECDYFLHNKYKYTIDEQDGKSKLIKKKIDKFLREPFRGNDRDVQDMDLTNWEYLVFKWNRGGSYIKIPENVTQPDYTKLPTHSKYRGKNK